MIRRNHIVRICLVAAALLTAYVGLACRLVQLQVVQSTTLSNAAERNWLRQFEIPALRGEIRDINGELLARSVPVKTICADPLFTAERAHETAEKLAPLLRMDVEDLLDKLTRPCRYVRLKTKVDGETVKQIKKLGIKGLVYEDDFIRVYPNGILLSHVLGWTDATHRGVAGIELTMDKVLAGQPGWRIIETDRRGRENVAERREAHPVRDGAHVVLTVDQVIQHIVESELDEAMAKFNPKAALSIVMRPATGEILAMSNRPTFDPNAPGKYPMDALRNRCISDVAEPGSVYKIVPIAGALNDRVVSLSTRFDCENGAFRYGGHTLHDAHPHGVLSVLEILAASSNIGAAKVGISMGTDALYRYIQAFGFGRKTGIHLPGEVAGIVPSPRRWWKVSIAQIPMGQGIAVTPIQMLSAMATIANDGVQMYPLIVKRILSPDGKTSHEFSPVALRRVIEPQTAAQMKRALKAAVLQAGQTALDGSVTATINGTAPKAASSNWVVAGKTGTAWKVENGQYVRKYYSSFIGFLPADNPQLCILVTLDEPQQGGYYGGTVAAPVFRNIAEKAASYLGIPPLKKDSKRSLAMLQSR